jgi:hypothetical protein
MVTDTFKDYRKNRFEKLWARIFGWIGIFMFFAGIFQSLVSLFWIGEDVVKMDSFRIIFALIGFVLALANRQLGIFANAVGKILFDKFAK